MGTYATGKKKVRSVSDTLREAEHDHFLDCPNADIFIRIASTILDGILFFLLFSGVEHVSAAFTGLAPQLSKLISNNPFPPEQLRQIISFSTKVCELFMIYLYFFWTVVVFGGSPAKLLLGLRVLEASSGQKLSLGRAFIREGFRLIGVLFGGAGILFVYFRPDRRSFHDLATNTVVKKVHSGP